MDWVVRRYEDEDESCCASMWLRSYAGSNDVRDWLEKRGKSRELPRTWFLRATPDESRVEERYYWGFHRPMVLSLLRGAETRVLCDPERVHSTPGEPSCIWAWACVSPGLVHYVAVKQDAIRAGHDVAAEMVADLLADRLDAPQAMTWEQRELRKLKLLPESWSYDGRWLSAMRQLRTVSAKYNGVLEGATRMALEAIGQKEEA